MSAHPPFDLLAPLPDRHLAIEASAGTGKTFTLAALATRFVAERDVRASQLLIVTFTRAATTELRARVRDRFTEAVDHLAPEVPAATADPLLAHLAAGPAPVRAERRRRLDQAVTDFDAATIATIHGFAAQVLGSLGDASGADPDLRLVNDDREFAREVCADALAAEAMAGTPAAELPTLAKLATATNAVLGIPDLVLVPTAGDPGQSAADGTFRRLVDRSVAQIREQRQRTGTRSFADLLTDLRHALQGPGSAAARASLRDRYRVALIDEFQDTDPVQWDIFRTLFAPAEEPLGPRASLILVGDPKQAIYAFRGANIHTYLEAMSGDLDIASLPTNHRSDASVLRSLEVLLQGATFGDAGIAYRPVLAGRPGADRRLADAPTGSARPALSLRLALDDELARTTRGAIAVEAAEHAIYPDLARQVQDLLESAAIPVAGAAGEGASRPVRPSDVAVLVRSAKEAEAIQAALVDQGIPAVLRRGQSVLQSAAATQWRWLLEAVAVPSDPSRARTFALSWFGGHPVEWVADTEEAGGRLAEVQDLLHAWADTLSTGTVDDLVRRVWADTDVVANALTRPSGDRDLTDLEHIAELFRTEVAHPRVGVAGLLEVLQEDPEADPDTEFDGNVASRRVESEAEAVQVMTVWVAKGLEFPITCCPTLWRSPQPQPVVYQDPDRGRRAFDLADGTGWPDKAGARARKALANEERAGEDLRLLYVALTRAKHQTVVWWTRCQGSERTALARLLFARTADGRIDPAAYAAASVDLPPDEGAAAFLAPLVEAAGDGRIQVTTIGAGTASTRRWVDPRSDEAAPALAVATIDRPFDRSARRWSFTAITARAVDAHPHDVDEPPEEGPGGADEHLPADDDAIEVDLVAPVDAQRPEHGAAPPVSPLAALPAGADFGTLVHAVLEHVDFTTEDLSAAVADRIDHELAWRAIDLAPVSAGELATDPRAGARAGRELLIAGIVEAIGTPLGPLFEGRALRDLHRADRLDELAFDLRLGEGGTVATDRDLGRALVDHLPATDPFHPWAQGLAGGAFDVELAGHLTGSIDVVARVRTAAGTPRFVIVDYKTNRLHDRRGTPRPADYHPAQVAAAMADHHYPLQALLYAVALHRYLRWRLPGYASEVHLGGAAYLFLRGMSGPDVAVSDGVPHGVCSWPIPPAAVEAASDVLDGRLGEVAR